MGRKIALSLAILAVAINAWIAAHIFEGIPHLEDEFAYVWQAQVIARGDLTRPSPPNPKSFLVPFVVDYNGRRFGKYPLGWPVVLSFAERLSPQTHIAPLPTPTPLPEEATLLPSGGEKTTLARQAIPAVLDLSGAPRGNKPGPRTWVNPLLAGMSIWLIYLLGKRTLGEATGLLAAGLTITSPFFLMNSSVLLSHAWGLWLTLAFTLAWLDTIEGMTHLPAYLPPLTAGLTLGVLALSRPLTALGVAFPFGIQGLILLRRGSPGVRRRVLLVGVLALLVGSLHFLWQYAVTGDPLLNPYTLWWEYDRLGFGPGHGVRETGHTLKQAWWNTRHSLNAGLSDLFGWGKYSWIFLPFGLWAMRRERRLWPLITVFPILVLLYAAYWVGAWLFGPRYYYEGLPGLALLTAAGIVWLAGHPQGRWRKARALALTAIVTLLVTANVLWYLPARLGPMKGLYRASRARLDPFLTEAAQQITPALVFVHPEHWREYDVLLELSNPYFDTPFVFAYSRGAAKDAIVTEMFTGRRVYHYYPDEPWRLYTAPR